MKPEAQRIAIAEACGWINCQFDWAPWDSEGREGKQLIGIAPVNQHLPAATSYWRIPIYCWDLDAMHQAEEMLHKSFEQSELYAFKLNLIVLKTKHSGIGINFAVLNATAAQRAEAFLRTIGKWTEDP